MPPGALPPSDEAEVFNEAEGLREKKRTSRSCDEPYPLPFRARPTDPISYSSSTLPVAGSAGPRRRPGVCGGATMTTEMP
eukprot:scaffold57305_cov50-Phaeocystis_antarctica.AAC.6